MNFNDFYWHDSVIKSISIDRNMPGINDVVVFEIECAEEGFVKLVFEETYWVFMSLNFGIIADETIHSACLGEVSDPDLVGFFSKWNGLMDHVELNSYQINLNSTGSTIKILAKGFKIIKQ